MFRSFPAALLTVPLYRLRFQIARGRARFSAIRPQKIIFTADYIEPARFKAKNLAHIRWLAFHDLNQAVYQILEDTLHYLDSGKGEIDEMSRSAYRYYHNLYDETDDKGDSLTV